MVAGQAGNRQWALDVGLHQIKLEPLCKYYRTLESRRPWQWEWIQIAGCFLTYNIYQWDLISSKQHGQNYNGPVTKVRDVRTDGDSSSMPHCRVRSPRRTPQAPTMNWLQKLESVDITHISRTLSTIYISNADHGYRHEVASLTAQAPLMTRQCIREVMCELWPGLTIQLWLLSQICCGSCLGLNVWEHQGW